jgi:predicted DNA-binding antitoxin AbrB/MazE fold protein
MTVEAVYSNGVFTPLSEVAIRENERVRLEILPAPQDVEAWLTNMDELHREIIARSGILPDSTPDIAEDRLR